MNFDGAHFVKFVKFKDSGSIFEGFDGSIFKGSGSIFKVYGSIFEGYDGSIFKDSGSILKG